MAPEMPSGEIELGATVCPELPTWRSIGSQPASQIGPRRGELGVQRIGKLLRERDVLLLLDAAADRHDALGLRQIDRLLRLLKRRLRLLADRRGVERHLECANRRRRRAARRLIGPKRADLNGDQVRRFPSGTTSAVSLP